MYDQNDYQLNYQKLTFEDKLRVYRMETISDYLKDVKSDVILEIGCGNDPLFKHYDDFKVLDIVEPGDLFYDFTNNLIDGDPRISMFKGFIENVHSQLRNDYDIIIIGGFLHEIDNPEAVLAIIKKISGPNTIIITYVPNANSFHRLLAFESGLIQSTYEFSENDKLFGRRNVYNTDSITALFVNCGFMVTKTDTYFIKPFTHDQMDLLMGLPFFTKEILAGFFRMTKYMPNMGCEIFLASSALI